MKIDRGQIKFREYSITLLQPGAKSSFESIQLRYCNLAKPAVNVHDTTRKRYWAEFDCFFYGEGGGGWARGKKGGGGYSSSRGGGDGYEVGGIYSD